MKYKNVLSASQTKKAIVDNPRTERSDEDISIKHADLLKRAVLLSNLNALVQVCETFRRLQKMNESVNDEKIHLKSSLTWLRCGGWNERIVDLLLSCSCRLCAKAPSSRTAKHWHTVKKTRLNISRYKKKKIFLQ